MTRREWVKQHVPEDLDPAYDGGVRGCPARGAYDGMPGERPSMGQKSCPGVCEKCWGAEIPNEEKDMINPDHYKVHKHECFREIKALLSPEEYRGWLKGSVLKYRYRTGHKDDPAQENSKSDWFMDKLMEELGMIELDFVNRMEGK